jgi:hypothetical protein
MLSVFGIRFVWQKRYRGRLPCTINSLPVYEADLDNAFTGRHEQLELSPACKKRGFPRTSDRCQEMAAAEPHVQ